MQNTKAEENYVGVKFNVHFVENKIRNANNLGELIRWCGEFHSKKLAPACLGGYAGNLSFRIETQKMPFIITGAGIQLCERLNNEHFVEVLDCDINNKTVVANGCRNPSSESILHYSIYKKCPQINAIFHGHSEIILKAAEMLKIVSTEKEFPYGTIELIDSVLDVLGNEKFIIMKNHGFISLGETINDAGEQTLKYYKLAMSQMDF